MHCSIHARVAVEISRTEVRKRADIRKVHRTLAISLHLSECIFVAAAYVDVHTRKLSHEYLAWVLCHAYNSTHPDLLKLRSGCLWVVDEVLRDVP